MGSPVINYFPLPLGFCLVGTALAVNFNKIKWPPEATWLILCFKTDLSTDLLIYQLISRTWLPQRFAKACFIHGGVDQDSATRHGVRHVGRDRTSRQVS